MDIYDKITIRMPRQRPQTDLPIIRICLDGGSGSGNFGHSGRPGKVGGSGGSGKSNLTGTKESGFGSAAKKQAGEKKAGGGSKGGVGKENDKEAAKTPHEEMRGKLLKLGHSKEAITKSEKLLYKHTNGYQDQKEADAEIANHIKTGDEIGKLFKDKAKIEEEAWREKEKSLNKYAQNHYKEQIEDFENDMKPGGILENYTKEQLQSYGMWPEEPEMQILKVYRKGSMDKDVLSFSSSSEGANMAYLTSGNEGAIGHDVSYTMDEMLSMSYRPIAGIVSMDVGYVGESEVLFAAFPD